MSATPKSSSWPVSAHQVLRLPTQPAFSEATRSSAVRGSPGGPGGKRLGPGAQVPPRGARGRGQHPQRRHRQGALRGAETTSAALTATVARSTTPLTGAGTAQRCQPSSPHGSVLQVRTQSPHNRAQSPSSSRTTVPCVCGRAAAEEESLCTRR